MLQLLSYKRLIVFLISSAFLLLGLFAKGDERLEFYFDGTFDEHKKWFPNLYVLSYCFFKLYIPFFVGAIIWALWQKRTAVKIPRRTYFLCVIYILLSWILPEYYPFSKYPMYSSWPNEIPVFLLRDDTNRMIPLNQVCVLNGAELSHIYWTAKNANIEDSLIGKKMFDFIKNNRNTALLVKDSIYLNKVILSLHNDKIQTNEVQLYKGTLE